MFSRPPLSRAATGDPSSHLQISFAVFLQNKSAVLFRRIFIFTVNFCLSRHFERSEKSCHNRHFERSEKSIEDPSLHSG